MAHWLHQLETKWFSDEAAASPFASEQVGATRGIGWESAMGWFEAFGLALALIVLIGLLSFWASSTPRRRAAIFALPQRRTIISSRFVATNKAADVVCRWIWHPGAPETYQTGRIEAEEPAGPNLADSPLIAGGFLVRAIKRTADIVLSTALLLFAAPFLLLVALAIKVEGGGPVLYRQTRLGRAGVPFTLLKFRTMRVDAEKDGARWAQQNDGRVTRIGRFLRVTRIDEIPQALSVLSGKMSFVGPRPERPEFLSDLTSAIPHYKDRLQVKPGITGWAQVNYPYGASIEDARQKLAYDLYYIQHYSLALDLIIVLKTLRVALFAIGSR